MKCFYHFDDDGKCGASIVSIYTGNCNKEDFISVDYVREKPPINLVSEGEAVYLIDYSFKPNTKYVLDRLLELKCDIVWIDHHTSSINLEKDFPELKQIKGIRSEEACGAALTYMYFYHCKFEDVPMYVKYVSDYDCWKFKYDPKTTFFILGLDSFEADPLDSVWKALYEEACRGGYQGYVEGLIKDGEIIKPYVDRSNAFCRDAYVYESIIGGHKALVINMSSNSWIFGEKNKEYPLVCTWTFNGDEYSYSIYSIDPTVNCSAIAEALGGGGSRGAAGFSSKEQLFCKA